MPSHQFPDACCSKFKHLAIRYIDESAKLDDPLDTIAKLCEAAIDPERIEPEVVEGVGQAIREYLESRRVLEHAFFDRTLLFWQSDDLAVEGEIKRLRAAIEEEEE